MKKNLVCAICGKIDVKNRNPNHHIVPKHTSPNSQMKVWLCTECHTFLHLAESKGLCELPENTNREFIVENSRTLGLMKQAVKKEEELSK